MSGAEDAIRFYDVYDEHARFESAEGQFEFARSMELLLRHLPAAPARVMDVGGGPGAYAEALGSRGYEVHLLDITPRHVRIAQQRPGIASAREGDARQLPWNGGSADAVLLMGPLYHLVEAAGRQQALLEARRVLKRGGVLAAAGISRFASLLDGLCRGLIDDERFRAILLRDLDSGDHRNESGDLNFFTTSRFHRPDELAGEIAHAGFVSTEVFAVEGPVWASPNLNERWADLKQREFLMETLRRIEREPSIVGASAHLLAFARRG